MAMAMVQCLHGDEISCQGRDHSVVSSLSYKRGLCGPNGLGNGRSSEKAAGAVASDGLSHEGAAAERAAGDENSGAPPGKTRICPRAARPPRHGRRGRPGLLAGRSGVHIAHVLCRQN